jgi:PAS domain S-box-containing protein
VIAIDPQRRIMAFNQSAAEVVLSIAMDHMGRPIADVLPVTCQELGKILVRALSQERGFTNIEVCLKGQQKRILSVSASPIRNEKGEILGAVETFRDLTEIKHLEEKATRQQRLAALGEMAAGVAHEIRNPLGGIELYASTLKRRFDKDSKEAEIAEKIIAASGALNRIVSDMLTFTRSREPVRKETMLERVCASVLDMAARALEEKKIQVEVRHALGRRKIMLDSDQIAQAFLNVLLNAVQFTPEGGKIIISSAIELSNKTEYAVVEFEDGGSGISEDIIDKLFNPFFTTRKDGTGLGLAIVHKIMQDHGAVIGVENRPPRGACFSFRLPVQGEQE